MTLSSLWKNVLLALWLLPIALPSAAAPRYGLADLGPLPMAGDDAALALNDAGQVAGWREAEGVIHAALWTHGKVRDLGTPPGYASSVAHAVNRQGQTVGWATTSRNLVDSLATTHACLFDANGKVTDLGTLGGRDSEALGINAAGQIVGGSLRADGNRHAFLWAHGKMTDIGTLTGGKFSLAYAVSDSGTVIGIAETAQTVVHAFQWKHGAMTDLGALSGGQISLGLAINRSGIAAGAIVTGNEYHAALFRQSRVQDLGTLGSDPAEVCGLNDQGQAVGASNLTTVVRHAFLWEAGRMTDLNTRTPSGWTLLTATAINERGQIVGTARRASGPVHAMLLTPLPR